MQEAPHILRRKLRYTKLLVLHDVHEFVEEEPVGERHVRNHGVLKCDCGHVREVRQIRQGESHLDEFAVERRIARALTVKDHKTSRIENKVGEKRAHGVFLA